MSDAINGKVGNMLEHITVDAVPAKDVSKKEWEKTFLMQQVRWQKADISPSYARANSNQVIDGQGLARAGRQAEQNPLAQNSMNLSNKAPPVISSDKALDVNRDVSAKKNDPQQISTIQRTSREINASKSLLYKGSEKLYEHYLAKAEALKVNIKVRTAQDQSTVRIDKEYGGLAVYHNNKLSLWFRAKSRLLLESILKTLNFFNLKPDRIVFNGQLIKKSRGE